jgi:pimeloyl-ACP methyl ester carboxylesterase
MFLVIVTYITNKQLFFLRDRPFRSRHGPPFSHQLHRRIKLDYQLLCFVNPHRASKINETIFVQNILIVMKLPFGAVVLCLLSWIDNTRALISYPVDAPDLPGFDWSALKPSPELEWHECYTPPYATEYSNQQTFSSISTSKSRTLSCARLSLTLDYHNTTNPHNVSVPIIKISSPPSPSHRGIIFTSFGGAGNSRVKDLVAFAHSSPILDMIDQEFEYDFLTFDNRGFGYSSPSAKCFDNILDGALWEERMAHLSGVMSTREGEDSEERLGVRIAAAQAKSELCLEQSEEAANIRRHMTTAYAARDMLEILKRLPDESSQSFPASSGREKVSKIPKLKFLGLSYGTMLGQTFASLYPEHISRMVLDGTCDANDWVDSWQMGHLMETDAIWATFYDDCFTAREACPLWRAPDTAPVNIEKRVNDFLESLKQRPVYTVSDGNARLITYRDVKLAIYWTTMAPYFAGPSIATLLDSLMKGNTNVTLRFPFESVPTASDFLHEQTQDDQANSNADAGTALNCGDTEDITNSSIADFKKYLSALEDQSSVGAFFQGERKIRCLGWSIRPAWRFTGPFTSKRDNGSSKLTTPILFMGNKLDPMTSLRNARKMAKEFLGSVVLEQDARGHCALGNVVPSPCTLRYLRNYLRNGSLPEFGTICGEDCNLFDGSCFGDTNA